VTYRCWCTGRSRRFLRMLMYLPDSGWPVKGLLGPSSACMACLLVVAWRLKSARALLPLYSPFPGFSSFQCAR